MLILRREAANDIKVAYEWYEGQREHFDEKLCRYVDMRISFDLDDGAKVNYGKFGDLLAEVKAVHGKSAEEV